MSVIDWTALLLVAVGAFNWGLVGIAYFIDTTANWNLVNILFDGIPELEFGIYFLVGIAALWTAYLSTRLAGVRIDTEEPDLERPGRTTK